MWGLVRGSTLVNHSLLRKEERDIYLDLFSGVFLACEYRVVGPAMSRCRRLLVDDPRVNNKSEVCTPLLCHARCCKKTDCCRAIQSQLHSSYRENKGTGTLDAGSI